MKEIKKVDIGFLLGIMTLNVGIWLYLRNVIISLTVLEPANWNLFPLSFIHYFSFVCSIASMILLFFKGLSFATLGESLENNLRIEKFIRVIKDFLFHYWLFIFLTSSLTLPVNSLLDVIGIKWLTNPAASAISFLIVVALGYYLLRNKLWSFFNTIRIWPFFILFLFALPYIIFLSSVSANISCTTEKIFYTKNDTVRASIEVTGYILLPEIKSITYNDKIVKDSVLNQTFSFILNNNLYPNWGNNYIGVTFSSQVFNFERTKYFRLNVTDQ